MNTLISGCRYCLEGFSLITKPGLKRFVILPLIINIIVFAGFFLLSRHYINELNQWVANLLPSWLQWLSILMWILFYLSFFIILIYTFVTVANIIASPFNSLLSEKIELYITNQLPEQKTFLTMCKEIPRIILRQLAILFYYIPRAIFLLLLFFVPIIQMIAAILWFVFNAWYLSFMYLDYPTDNQRIPLADVRAWLKQNRLLALGFGMTTLVLTMIPFINFFVIPAAVAGATKLWIVETRQIKVKDSSQK